jgi:hypothetical protein
VFLLQECLSFGTSPLCRVRWLLLQHPPPCKFIGVPRSSGGHFLSFSSFIKYLSVCVHGTVDLKFIHVYRPSSILPGSSSWLNSSSSGYFKDVGAATHSSRTRDTQITTRWELPKTKNKQTHFT